MPVCFSVLSLVVTINQMWSLYVNEGCVAFVYNICTFTCNPWWCLKLLPISVDTHDGMLEGGVNYIDGSIKGAFTQL